MQHSAHNIETIVAKARSAAQSGRVKKARGFYKIAIQALPGNAALLLEAGVLEGQAGNIAAARRHLEKAHKNDRNNPDISFNLAHVERAEERLAQAENLFRRTLELDPDYADAAFGLAEALYSLECTSEALQWIDRALASAPRDPEILHVKALCLLQASRIPEAREVLRAVIAIKPDFWNAKLNLASTLEGDSELGEAIGHIEEVERAVGIPDDFLAKVAGIYSLANDMDNAQRYADLSIEKGANLANALNVKGRIHSWLGRFDEAESTLRKAIEIDPDNGAAYGGLAQIKRLEPEATDRLKNILQGEKFSILQRIPAGFALFQLLQNAGDYDGAFSALSEANRLQALTAPFDEDRSIATSEATMRAFSAEFLSSRQAEGSNGEGAIFIVGMPRSGTTLTEQIFAGHPDVHAGGERGDVPALRRSIGGYPDAVREVPSGWARDAGDSLLRTMFDGQSDKRYATDKLPGNYAALGLISWILPKARLIYCHREPCDNALSLFEQNFGANLKFSVSLERIATVYRLHLEYMDHWQNTCGLDVHTVNYDELVRDPETHARAMFDFAGLDWRSECLDTQRPERTILTASQWQARQPINAKSVGRWRRYEKQMQPFIAAMGDKR